MLALNTFNDFQIEYKRACHYGMSYDRYLFLRKIVKIGKSCHKSG